MKAADLYTATTIVNRLARIAAIKAARRDLNRTPQFSVLIVGGSNEWVPMSKDGADRAYAALMAELDAEAAALRRRAAQISLSL